MFEAYIGWESDENEAITEHLSYRKRTTKPITINLPLPPIGSDLTEAALAAW
jgi:hypothetical protein